MEAVTNLSEVLAVTGRVLPVSLSNIVLHAQLRDGTVVSGESAILKDEAGEGQPDLPHLHHPRGRQAPARGAQAIAEADLIVMWTGQPVHQHYPQPAGQGRRRPSGPQGSGGCMWATS